MERLLSVSMALSRRDSEPEVVVPDVQVTNQAIRMQLI